MQIQKDHCHCSALIGLLDAKLETDSKRGRAGGAALYLHATLPIPIVLSDTTPAPYYDALWVQIPLRGSDSLLLGVVHRSPSSPPDDDQLLIQTLEQRSSSYHLTHLLASNQADLLQRRGLKSFNRALGLNMSLHPPGTIPPGLDHHQRKTLQLLFIQTGWCSVYTHTVLQQKGNCP
ncbi:hypothetical protein T265_07604 [Opisthorchis viverrini]|uniref:Uncharacterized protein n=1 Tax=Opisthorchis viverrini TaxID=6198 RepID=A0A074ZCD0_OPIVI|nr:hypothetical protein T265_07604 [Opisthorchis viverrini]KER24818.1 hypothetical protein T265_07604 [Opisthorchis viverrini]